MTENSLQFGDPEGGVSPGVMPVPLAGGQTLGQRPRAWGRPAVPIPSAGRWASTDMPVERYQRRRAPSAALSIFSPGSGYQPPPTAASKDGQSRPRRRGWGGGEAQEDPGQG